MAIAAVLTTITAGTATTIVTVIATATKFRTACPNSGAAKAAPEFAAVEAPLRRNLALPDFLRLTVTACGRRSLTKIAQLHQGAF